MSKFTFNQNQVVFTQRGIEQPSQELVKNTLGLWNADIEDAMKFGGELTRAAIGAMKFKGDRKYITVDSKVHMLMRGNCPAIPGWHTDGVPRHANGAPTGGPPMLTYQRDGNLTAPHYHLLATGYHCLTQFLVSGSMEIEIPNVLADSSHLYEELTINVNQRLKTQELGAAYAPSCQVAEWDWWNIHQGVISTGFEWRYLIRVTESDYLPPEKDLREVIRTQQNVYVPTVFGW